VSTSEGTLLRLYISEDGKTWENSHNEQTLALQSQEGSCAITASDPKAPYAAMLNITIVVQGKVPTWLPVFAVAFNVAKCTSP